MQVRPGHPLADLEADRVAYNTKIHRNQEDTNHSTKALHGRHSRTLGEMLGKPWPAADKKRLHLFQPVWLVR